MGLIRPQKVKVKWGTKNKKHYESLGYIYTKMKDEFEVDVEDLTKNTYTLVECICDNCKKIFPQRYEAYNRYVKEDGKTYCNECGTKLFTGKGIRKTRLLKSKSYAQWLIDNYGDNALELYWDYDKNTVDPWEICYKGDETIWIKCQEKDYHGSYETTCYNFVKGNRCPFCSHKSNKVHPLDSLKQDIINKHGEEFFNKVWSDKNTVNPSTIAPNSTTICWWNCTEGKHEPYQRNCTNFGRFISTVIINHNITVRFNGEFVAVCRNFNTFSNNPAITGCKITVFTLSKRTVSCVLHFT